MTEQIEVTEADWKELDAFIHSCAVNSLRLLANSGRSIISRKQLRRWGISSGVEEELQNMGVMYPADNDGLTVIIEKGCLHDCLKQQAAANPHQKILGVC